jgi:hypothetical protein
MSGIELNIADISQNAQNLYYIWLNSQGVIYAQTCLRQKILRECRLLTQRKILKFY